MNRITIIGNLTRDPESRTTQAGKDVCSFTVAVNRRQKDQNGNNVADFFRVSAWNEMGHSCQKYLSKGKKVAVVGSVSVSTYTAQDGTTRASMDIMAQEVEFLSPRDADGNSGQAPTAPAPQDAPAQQAVNVPDDELPF